MKKKQKSNSLQSAQKLKENVWTEVAPGVQFIMQTKEQARDEMPSEAFNMLYPVDMQTDLGGHRLFSNCLETLKKFFW